MSYFRITHSPSFYQTYRLILKCLYAELFVIYVASINVVSLLYLWYQQKMRREKNWRNFNNKWIASWSNKAQLNHIPALSTPAKVSSRPEFKLSVGPVETCLSHMIRILSHPPTHTLYILTYKISTLLFTSVSHSM